MSIAQRLGVLLQQRNITQKALAERVNINPKTLNTWLLRGEDLPSQYILPICRALNISPEYLLGGEEPTCCPQNPDEQFLLETVRTLDKEGMHIVIGKAIEEARNLRLSKNNDVANASGT